MRGRMKPRMYNGQPFTPTEWWSRIQAMDHILQMMVTYERFKLLYNESSDKWKSWWKALRLSEYVKLEILKTRIQLNWRTTIELKEAENPSLTADTIIKIYNGLYMNEQANRKTGSI
jgi:hypothetical protein